MLYDFKCIECGSIHTAKFNASDYDKYVMEDGRLKRKKCEKCKIICFYRHISIEHIPMILGGNKNYMSMERYWSQRKGEARRKEDSIAKVMAERHVDRVTSNIDKQQHRQDSDKRHQGYGKGHGEQKLSSD